MIDIQIEFIDERNQSEYFNHSVENESELNKFLDFFEEQWTDKARIYARNHNLGEGHSGFDSALYKCYYITINKEGEKNGK